MDHWLREQSHIIFMVHDLFPTKPHEKAGRKLKVHAFTPLSSK